MNALARRLAEELLAIDPQETGAEAKAERLAAAIDTPHVVEVTGDDWFTEHSIACRLDGLRHCPIHRRLRDEDWLVPSAGRYLVEVADDELLFTPEAGS